MRTPDGRVQLSGPKTHAHSRTHAREMPTCSNIHTLKANVRILLEPRHSPPLLPSVKSRLAMDCDKSVKDPSEGLQTGIAVSIGYFFEMIVRVKKTGSISQAVPILRPKPLSSITCAETGTSIINEQRGYPCSKGPACGIPLY